MRKLSVAALSLIYIVPLSCALAADQPQPAALKLGLEDAVSLALRDNRDLRLKSEEVRKAAALIAEARASLFPSLTAGGHGLRPGSFTTNPWVFMPARPG